MGKDVCVHIVYELCVIFVWTLSLSDLAESHGSCSNIVRKSCNFLTFVVQSPQQLYLH